MGLIHVDDPTEVVAASGLIALLTFAVVAVAAFLQHRKIAHANRAVLSLLGIVVLGLYAVLVGALTAVPWGWVLLPHSLALGGVLGMLAFTARRPRPVLLTRASWITAAAAVAACALVTTQLPATARPDAALTGSVAPPTAAGEPTAAAPGEPAATEPAPTQSQPLAYHPRRVLLPSGLYTLVDVRGICLQEHGTTPVAVTVSVRGGIQVTQSDGMPAPIGDVTRLRPCGEDPESDPTLLFAPDAAIAELGGGRLLLTDEMPVALIAHVVSLEGERFAWVWRRVDGVVHTGLVPSAQINAR